MMPFVTEELWQMLGQNVGQGRFAPSLLEAPYPARRPVDEAAERSFGPVLGVVEAIRNVRGEMNIPWKTVLSGVEVGGLSAEALATLRAEPGRVERLGNVQGLVLHPAGRAAGRRPQCAVSVGDGFEVLIPLAGAVDMAAETARVDKELARIAAELEGVEKRLANPSFVERAPKEVVDEARARVEELGEKRRNLEAHRALLAGDALPGATPAPVHAPTAAAAPAVAAVPPAPLARREPARMVVKQKANLIRKPTGKPVRKPAAGLVRRGPAAMALPAPKKAPVKPKVARPKVARKAPARKGGTTKRKPGAAKRRPSRR
jgi:valyl-tRNA synthetase